MTGTRPPLVLVHGWSIDSSVWRYLPTWLADEYELHCVDLPGHGGVPVEQDARMPEDFHSYAVEYFAHWCRARGVTDAPMLAWAWGTQVVIDAVARELAAPAAVMLLSFAPPFQTPELHQAVLRDWPRVAALFAAMMGDTLPESMIDELRQTMLRAAPAAVAAVQAKRWQPPGPDFRLPPGSVAVVGADDKLLPPRNGAALLDAWDVPLRLIPGAGHIPFVERPGEFDRALKDWLTAISTKA